MVQRDNLLSNFGIPDLVYRLLHGIKPHKKPQIVGSSGKEVNVYSVSLKPVIMSLLLVHIYSTLIPKVSRDKDSAKRKIRRKYFRIHFSIAWSSFFFENCKNFFLADRNYFASFIKNAKTSLSLRFYHVHWCNWYIFTSRRDILNAIIAKLGGCYDKIYFIPMITLRTHSPGRRIRIPHRALGRLSKPLDTVRR